MLTREQVIEMARELDQAAPHSAYYSFIPVGLERLVNAAYKRGVEDAAKVCEQTYETYCGANMLRFETDGEACAEAIRKLLEDTCTTS